MKPGGIGVILGGSAPIDDERPELNAFERIGEVLPGDFWAVDGLLRCCALPEPVVDGQARSALITPWSSVASKANNPFGTGLVFCTSPGVENPGRRCGKPVVGDRGGRSG